jgi:hypothetical protein
MTVDLNFRDLISEMTTTACCVTERSNIKIQEEKVSLAEVGPCGCTVAREYWVQYIERPGLQVK